MGVWLGFCGDNMVVVSIVVFWKLLNKGHLSLFSQVRARLSLINYVVLTLIPLLMHTLMSCSHNIHVDFHCCSFHGVPAEERLHWRSFLVKLGADNLKGVKNEELLVACHKSVIAYYSLIPWLEILCICLCAYMNCLI